MLSAERDRLREVANNLERYGFADHGENRRDLIRMLRDVADTVWELRNLNVDVQAENDDLKSENAKLREYAAKVWGLFIRHGAVHTCDLSEVDAVRDGLRELGVEMVMEEEEYVNGIEVLAGLCDKNGLQHWYSEAMACDTHVFIDKAGNPHECWEAPSGMVNVVISMTPEQAVQLGSEVDG